MNRKTLFAALACALLVFSMLGCGTTNHLKSIQLSTSNTLANAGTNVVIYGTNAPGWLYAWGNYSNGSQKLLGGSGLAYNIAITPNSFVLDNSTNTYVPLVADPNATPAQTIQLSPAGEITAVAPFACTWENFAVAPATAPSFAYVGSYTITATYGGFTSPPAFVPVASDVVGVAGTSNPDGLCNTPPSTQ